MTDPWVCIDCGARQAAEGACKACGHELTLDLHDLRTREFMYDIDLRLAQRREGRLRILGVAFGMVTIVSLWFVVPGYWSLRGRLYPGLPIFADQWIMMALLGYLFTKLLERNIGKKRFPYLRLDLSVPDGSEAYAEPPAVSDYKQA